MLHTDAFFMHCVSFRQDTSMHIRGRSVTECNATHEKRIRMGLKGAESLVSTLYRFQVISNILGVILTPRAPRVNGD